MPTFDKIIAEANAKGIEVGWSNPCIEIWFDAYFGKMHNYSDSDKCCSEFSNTFEKKTGQEYRKENPRNYELINRYGDEDKAIEIAERRFLEYKKNGFEKPSEMCPCTTLYKLVKAIRQKTNK